MQREYNENILNVSSEELDPLEAIVRRGAWVSCKGSGAGSGRISGAQQTRKMRASVRVLESIAAWRGYPQKLRLDNGPELAAISLAEWAESHQVKLEFIEPGKPMPQWLHRKVQSQLQRSGP